MAYDIYWDKVVLAMHMDDTGLTDVKGHTVALNGGAARSSAWSKFGGYSLEIPSSGSYVRVSASADFAFGTGDFDVSFFVRLDASGTQYMMQSDAIGTSGSDKWWIGYVSGQLGIGQHSTANKVAYTCTMNTGTEYYVRVCRVSGVTYVFLDGALLGSASTFSSTSFSQDGLSIGGISTPAYMTGFIDDLLICKGAGRSTSSFTVPLAAFAERLPAISGVVQDETDAYIQRLVRAYRRSTGNLVGEALSNATTGAYSIGTTSDDEHSVIMLDSSSIPPSGGVENALIYDRVIPV